MRKNTPPKIGVVASSIGVFSDDGKEVAESKLRAFIETLQREKKIHEDSIFCDKRIFAPHEADEIADLFVSERVDAVVILNSAFPNGNTFLRMAANPYLWRIPLIVTAPPEIDLNTSEWTTNAYCGLIMNNYAAKRIGRHLFCLGGWPDAPDYQEQFCRLMRVVYTIKQLRSETIGKIGDSPSGFHSASGDPLSYAKLMGVRVETIDMLAVLEAFKTGKTEGLEGTFEFSDSDIDARQKFMLRGKELLAGQEFVRDTAKLYCALKILIEANGFTSISLRCWPELLDIFKVTFLFLVTAFVLA
jgi:L-fucose isomerase-like protein